MKNKIDIIHCVGDSHANFFSGFDIMQPEWPSPEIQNRYPFFRSYRIGPALAYNLCDNNTTTKGRERLMALLEVIPQGSWILFCFGEIDCRAHILLQAEKQTRPIEGVITEVVKRYFKVIKEVQSRGYNPIIWGVAPSAPSDVNSKIVVPLQFLFQGSCSERNSVTRLFNMKCGELAEDCSALFINLFDYFIHPDQTPKLEFFIDEIHLSQKAMPIAINKINAILGTSFTHDPSGGDTSPGKKIYISESVDPGFLFLEDRGLNDPV